MRVGLHWPLVKREKDMTEQSMTEQSIAGELTRHEMEKMLTKRLDEANSKNSDLQEQVRHLSERPADFNRALDGVGLGEALEEVLKRHIAIIVQHNWDDIEMAIDNALDTHDFSGLVEDAVESALNNHDFGDAIGDVLDNFDIAGSLDWDREVRTVIGNMATDNTRELSALIVSSLRDTGLEVTGHLDIA